MRRRAVSQSFLLEAPGLRGGVAFFLGQELCPLRWVDSVRQFLQLGKARPSITSFKIAFISSGALTAAAARKAPAAKPAPATRGRIV